LRRVAYADALLRDYLDAFYAEVGAIHHEDLAGSDYVLLECLGCKAVYQEEIPNEALSHRFYEEWIDPRKAYDLYERKRNVTSYSFLARSIETIVRHLNRTPSSLKLFDFGMGWGNWCMFASAYGCEAFGCEISPERIRHAEAHGIKVLSYADLSAYQFDCINAEQVFEHVPEPLETLDYLKSALAPGGLIWVSVPDGGDIHARLKQWDWKASKDSPRSLNAVAPLEHLNCFSHEALVAMAGKIGLQPIRIPAKRPAHKTGPETRGQRIARILKSLPGAGAPRADASEDTFEGTSLFFTQAK
jgi:2-polyprenyl-3-methyl-5-hydroxy-6-metoxy-1,4-benzoquinol methylase